MRICIIGNCGGHIGSVFDGKRGPHEYIGAAASSPLEPMESLCRLAKEKTGRPLPLFDDWREMLDRLRPDVVAVDTIFCNHAVVSLFALERGIHVYCEKPAATSLDQLDQLEAAIKQKKARYFSMLTARFDPWFYTAKQLMKQGAVGKLLMAGGQKSYKLGSRPAYYRDRHLYGGTIPWVAIHAVDQLLWLTGLRCREVYAKQTRACNRGHGDLETAAALLLELEGGQPAHVNADYGRPEDAPTHGDDRIRLVGDAGVIEVINGRVYLMAKGNDGRQPLENLTPPPIFDGFLDFLESPDDPKADWGGLAASRVCLAARDSADLGRPIRLQEASASL